MAKEFTYEELRRLEHLTQSFLSQHPADSDMRDLRNKVQTIIGEFVFIIECHMVPRDTIVPITETRIYNDAVKILEALERTETDTKTFRMREYRV